MVSLSKLAIGSFRFHRALLLWGTVGIAVGASRIANDPSEVPSWLLMGGSALFLLLADIARDIDGRAIALAESSGLSRETARADVYRSHRASMLSVALAIAFVLWIGGLGSYGLWGHGSSRRGRSPSAPVRTSVPGGPATTSPRSSVKSTGTAAPSSTPVGPSSTPRGSGVSIPRSSPGP
jgi:hypothetical protein